MSIPNRCFGEHFLLARTVAAKRQIPDKCVVDQSQIKSMGLAWSRATREVIRMPGAC
jgi:hypothetical protein